MVKICGFCDCMCEFLFMDCLFLGILDDKICEEFFFIYDFILSKIIEICCVKEVVFFYMKVFKSDEINKVIYNFNKKKEIW